MRKYLDIDLSTQSIGIKGIEGEEVIVIGRHMIAKKLLENGVATVDPLGPENPLIFSAGPFSGSNFSNANRLSVGCKSPLTGGIKEAKFSDIISGKTPELVLTKAVQRMMNSNALSKKQLSNLKVFSGNDHNLDAQKPEVFDFASLNRKNIFN